MLQSLKYRVKIAKFRSGKDMKIPLDLKREVVQIFLNEFSVDEHIDLFCVSEALDRQFRDQNFEGYLGKSNNLIFSFFRDPVRFPAFQLHLEKLGLLNTLHYIEFGRKLIQ